MVNFDLNDDKVYQALNNLQDFKELMELSVSINVDSHDGDFITLKRNFCFQDLYIKMFLVKKIQFLVFMV